MNMENFEVILTVNIKAKNKEEVRDQVCDFLNVADFDDWNLENWNIRRISRLSKNDTLKGDIQDIQKKTRFDGTGQDEELECEQL